MGAVNFNWIDRESLCLYREEALALYMDIKKNMNEQDEIRQRMATLRNRIHHLGQVIGQQQDRYLELSRKAFGIKEDAKENK